MEDLFKVGFASYLIPEVEDLGESGVHEGIEGSGILLQGRNDTC